MIKGRTHVSTRKTLPSDASPQVGTFFPFAAGLASQSPGGQILPVFVCSLPPSADKSRDPPYPPRRRRRRSQKDAFSQFSILLPFLLRRRKKMPTLGLLCTLNHSIFYASPPLLHFTCLSWGDERLCLKTQDATAAPYSSRSRRGISGHFSAGAANI